MRPPLAVRERLLVAPGQVAAGQRCVAEETAIAFVYGGAAHAVMMASPCDLIDFAFGFSLSEGIVETPSDIAEVEIVDRGELGCELRIHLAPHCEQKQDQRRRHMAGPVGCGLCGIQSLAEAARSAPPVRAGFDVTPEMIALAMAELTRAQRMNVDARALHAAGFWHHRDGLLAVREDVGRHNALDKLHGAVARSGFAGSEGVVLLTSRVSVEMVQKAARMGAPVIAAISAPTDLAIRTADACGMTLIALARGDRCEVFTHADRLSRAGNRHSAPEAALVATPN